MSTDHACQSAAELAGRAVAPVTEFLRSGIPGGHFADGFDDQVAGAVVLLAFLDGMHGDLTGMLTRWHADVGDRVRGALGSPFSTVEGHGTHHRVGQRDTLTSVRQRAHDVLTFLTGHRGGPLFRELSTLLDAVEDAFSGALRRQGVPVDMSVRCATDMATVTGSLFGLHRRTPEPVPEPEPTPSSGTDEPAPVRAPESFTGLF